MGVHVSGQEGVMLVPAVNGFWVLIRQSFLTAEVDLSQSSLQLSLESQQQMAP